MPVSSFGVATSYVRLEYDQRQFNFAHRVADILGVADLQALGRDSRLSLRIRENDQKTSWHATFYEHFARELGALYRTFVARVAALYYSESFYFQDVPTLRVHLPDNRAVGEFHTDLIYGHPDGERSFWVPLTPAFATNTVLIESAPGAKDYVAAEANPGEVIVFDSGHLEHGNVVNETGVARVSFDFRGLPVAEYRPNQRTSINTNRAFAPGHYYAAEPMAGRRDVDATTPAR